MVCWERRITGVHLRFRPRGGSLPGRMAALHTTPDSPAAQLEQAEDGAECDPDQEEEEEEEEKGEEAQEVAEEEEEIVVEEEEEGVAEVVEDTQVEEVAEVEVEADVEEEDVKEVLAEEQHLALGTQERLSHGGDAKSPVLQEKGKKSSQPCGGGEWG